MTSGLKETQTTTNEAMKSFSSLFINVMYILDPFVSIIGNVSSICFHYFTVFVQFHLFLSK